MGIGTNDLNIILNLVNDGKIPKKFALCELGAQQISNNVITDVDLQGKFEKIYNIDLRIFEKKLGKVRPGKLVGQLEEISPKAAFSKDMWEYLGVNYTAIDIDKSPHSINIDLNFDDCPREYVSRFDLVTNLGTTEHVSNHSNAMKVMHDLVKPGGFLYHNVPMQGFEMHGMINYNPKFFWMLSRANGYKFCWMDVCQETVAYPLSQDIVEMILLTNPFNRTEEDLKNIKLQNMSVSVMMQKVDKAKYIPPIDMTQETMRDNKELLKRYFSKKSWLRKGIDALSFQRT